jgi:DNA primase catalytic core
MKKNDNVEKVKQAANIVDIISEFVSLKKKGKDYLGLCPFHNEKTPSFTVSEAKQTYKCFGCGKGGDVLSFLQEHEKHSFVEAIEFLAKKYSVQIERPEQSDSEKATHEHLRKLKTANQWAVDFFHKNLAKSAAANFFTMRGIRPEAIEFFQLGFHIDDYNLMSQTAQKEGIAIELLKELGLRYSYETKEFDFFKGRAIYPIQHPLFGHTIAFAGRTLKTKAELDEYATKSGNQIPKFTNSKESVLYKKSEALYNFFNAKKAISQKEYCIIVEGYHDVISLWQHGIHNVVAPCGTALTTEQLKLIKTRTTNVVFMLDGDNAGQKAIEKGIIKALELDMDVSIVPLPANEDPDTYAQTHTKEETILLVENNTSFIPYLSQYYLRSTKDNPDGRTKLLKNIIDIIAVIPNALKQELHLKDLAKYFSVELTSIQKQLKPSNLPVADANEIPAGELFGFEQAKHSIVKEQCCIFVDNKQDVITEHLDGTTNIVGHNCTIKPALLKELKKLTKHILFRQVTDFELFKDVKTFTEKNNITLAKHLISKGFNVTFTLFNELTNNNIEYNFVDFYIKAIVHQISLSNRNTKNIAIERTAELISFLSQTDRITTIDFVKQTFKTKDIPFNNTEFKKLLNDYQKKNSKGKEKDYKETTIEVENPQNLSGEQLKHLNDYGLFFDQNKIWYETKETGLKAYSNFIMEPILHTISINNVQKIFRLHNTIGQDSMISIGTDVLNSVDKFCAKCEEKGNYRFDGSKWELRKLKHYLMDRTVYSYEIEDLGWNYNNFWAWADGVSTTTGEFIPIDEYGLITVNKKSFYIKPFSKLYIDDNTVFVNERNFRYLTSNVTLERFADEYISVFGEKAKLSLCGYFTTLFSDFIFARKGKIPIFNFFGPKGTGKTEQAIALQYLFGERPDIINISSATPFASAYLLKIFVNAICLIDEYKNDIGIDKIEFLKSIYNRQGRVRGSIKEGVKVERIPVNSIVFLCGQEMPTFDVALLSRCIFISNYKDKHTQEEKDHFNRFQDMCREGLSHITHELLKFRVIVENDWEANFLLIEKELKEQSNKHEIDSRLIENYSIILASFKTLENYIKVNVTYQELLTLSIQCMKEQMSIISSSNELAIFWSTLTALFEKNQIKEGYNFVIRDEVQVNLTVDKGGNVEEYEYNFQGSKELLYLRWNGLYQVFSEQANKAKQEVMPERSLTFYLEHNKAFMGKKKNFRFKDNVNQALVFDYEMLGINLFKTTDEAKLNELEAGGKASNNEEGLPF